MSQAQTVFINELHYDNAGPDAGEGIEIAGPAGTDLSGWELALYNGNKGSVYRTESLSGVLPDQGNGFGTVSLAVVGLQNGAPDGMALVDNGTVVQFLSYEGAFTATSGPADGMTSTDIGVAESNATPAGSSLQLTGTGAEAKDFSWSGPSAHTFGSANTGQTLTNTDDEGVPTVTLVLTPAEIGEKGGVSTVTATLSRASSEAVEVTVSAVAVSPAVAGDFSLSTNRKLTITADATSSTGRVTITAADNNVDAPDKEVTVSASVSGGLGISAAAVTLTITDDDERGVTVEPTALNVPEGDSRTYTVVLDSEPTDEVTVTVDVPSGAEVSVDEATLRFTAGDWNGPRTVRVTAEADAVADDPVTLRHAVSGGDYGSVRVDDVTVTIAENDEPALTIGNERAGESDGEMVFAVTLSAASSEEVTVAYATANGTAMAGDDYEAQNGTLTFSPGSGLTQTIAVPIIDDAVDEAEEETFTVTLSNAQHATLADGEATGTIEDDDDPAVTVSFDATTYTATEGGSAVTVTVTLDKDPERVVTTEVTATPRNGAVAGDYSVEPTRLTFNPTDTRQTFTLTATDDDVDDDGETVELGFDRLPPRVRADPDHSTTKVVLTDNDRRGVTVEPTALNVPEGDGRTYTVALDTEPTGDVKVAVAGASGDVSVRGSPLTLMFTPSNWSHPQAATVDAAEDDDAIADAPVTLRHTVSGGDYGLVQVDDVTVTIAENDEPALTIGNERAGESDGEMVFEVRLSTASSNAVTVAYETSNGTARAGEDYEAQSGMLTFPANTTEPQTVAVPIIDDAVDEAGEETFTVTLSNARHATLADGEATGTIEDNDVTRPPPPRPPPPPPPPPRPPTPPPPPPPAAADPPMVTETSTTSVTVSWLAPTHEGPAITSYDLRYRQGSDGEFTDGPQDVTDTSATITGLRPDTAYEVQVRASSAAGDGKWSDPGLGRTRAPPPQPPAAPTVTETSTTSLTVSWLAPTHEGPAVTSYDLRYRQGSDGEFKDGPQDVTDTSATITGLSPDTAYEVQVRASSAAGDGKWSDPGLGRTRAPPPPAPAAPTVTETSTTSVTVSWSAPTDDGPPITSYDLRYRPGSDGEFTDGPQDVTGTSATITGLSPDTAYEVQVRASSAAGDGDWSAVGTVRTRVLILNDRFSLSLDLDGSEGDQSVSFLAVSPGGVVPIQMFGADIHNTRGLSIRVGYDSTQVVFEGFDVGDVLPDAQSLVERDSTFVEIGLASSEGQATVGSGLPAPTRQAGLVGTLRFRTTDAFSETEIRLAGAELIRGEPREAMTRSVSVVLQVAAPPSPDFDGSGVVDFPDFVLFAGAFGYREGDDSPARLPVRSTQTDSAQAGKYEAKYDLNGDGEIEFSDLVIFAGSFGKTVNRAPVFTAPRPVVRSVAENTPAGEPIGAPISAADADGNALTYSLWGADAENFAIDATTGQVRTEGTYDFEQKSGYSVIVRASDGEGGRVSLVVSIVVTDVDESPFQSPET